MTKLLSSLGVTCIVVTIAIAASAMMMAKPTYVQAGAAKWVPVTGMTGLSEAVLYGTPTKAGSGVFVERFKATTDVTFPPHFHPTDELVTVLSGTLMFNTGGFVGIPMGVHHFGMLKAGSIIEVSGVAPDTMNMIKSTKPSM